jgi:hypothetical protein
MLTKDHLLFFVGSNLDAADHAVIEAAVQPRDQSAPIILHKFGRATQAAGNGIYNFVLKPYQGFP